MVNEFLFLKETLGPLFSAIELFLGELGLRRGLSALKSLELLFSVEVLTCDPLHKLLVVDLTGHWHL